MKSLWMIGGGVQEVKALEFAKKLGFHTIVSDRDVNCAASAIADEFLCIDGRDFESLISAGLSLQEKLKLSAVFTFTEMTSTVAALGDYLNLPVGNLLASINCQHKARTKKIFYKDGLTTPKGFKLSKISEKNREKLKKLNFPLLVKPAFGSGGQGIKIFKDLSEFDLFNNVNKEKRFDSNHYVIEEMLLGSHHDVNGIFDIHGNFHPYGIVDRSFLENTFTEKSIMAPTKLEINMQKSLYNLLESCGRSLGIKKGPIKGDAILSNGKFYMLEVATRLHGPKFSLYAMPSISENYLAGFFATIVGDAWQPEFDLRLNGLRFQSELIETTIGKIVSFSTGPRQKNVNLLTFKKVGDRLQPLTNSHDAFGYILATGRTDSQVKEAISHAKSNFSIKVQ